MPGDHILENGLDRLLVADQVVIDDKDDPLARPAHRLELGNHLGTGLEPRAAAEGDDDVTELALKRAAARELEAAEGVPVHLQQVEPGHRHPSHVGLLGLLIAKVVPSGLPIGQEPGPGLLRLADEDDIGQVAEVIVLNRDPRAAADREAAPLFLRGQDLGHLEPLYAHAGKADDVGPGAAVEVDRFDVLVDQGDRVLPGRQCRKQGQGRNGQVGPFADVGQSILHAPVRDLELRIDQYDVSHAQPSPRNNEPLRTW